MKKGFIGALSVWAISGAVVVAQDSSTQPVIGTADVSEVTARLQLPGSDTPPVTVNEAEDAPLEAQPQQPEASANEKTGDTETSEETRWDLSLNDSDSQVPSGRSWFLADYLLWWVRKGETPPLVVTGSAADPFPGALDQPGTRVLFGDDGLDYGSLIGLRINLGTWLDDECRWGIEAGGFGLERGSDGFHARGDANGQPFLAAPFVNAITGNDNVYFISQNFADPALTALLTGGVRVSSTTSLWSWEVNGVVNLARDDTWVVDALVGFRQVSLGEDLSYRTAASNIAQGGAASFLGTTLDPGFVVATFDRFRTENQFDGAQFGARIDHRWGCVTLDLVGKLALGSMREEVTIHGRTRTDAPLPVQQAVGGIYAQASNVGDPTRNVFAVVPEIGINLAVDVTANTRAGIGYTFMYLSNVVRPGDQINPAINPNQVPIDPGYGTPGGPNRPAFDWKSTEFWAQGVNFFVEFRY